MMSLVRGNPECNGGIDMKWERRDGAQPRPHDHFREDGWSIYLFDQVSSVWMLCRPDGEKILNYFEPSAGLLPKQMDAVFAWADGEIARIPSHEGMG